MKAYLQRSLSRLGIRIITRNSPEFDPLPRNVEPEFLRVHQACAAYTCTSFEAQYGLWRAAEYAVRCDVPGDFVECGVYKGGSVMVAAMAFSHFGDVRRRFWLYDTFEGMTEPTARDVDFSGRTPHQHLSTWSARSMDAMAYSPLEEVRQNLARTGLAPERFVTVKGKVEDTIPGAVPDGPISILRLDTDWYESTRHELVHLFPRLSPGGVLIVDDYLFWRGSREACDEYIRQHQVKILLNRLDRAGAVIGIKPG
jgi:hypothetical protein